jgi:hypothetical protein
MFQLELDRLSSQLELLRQRHTKNGGAHRGVMCKIAAIQRVISEVAAEEEQDDGVSGEDDSATPDLPDGHSLNNVIAAVTDKIVCAAMSGGDDGCGDGLDMSVESAATTLNHSGISRLSVVGAGGAALDDKSHYTNEISV